MIEQQLAHSLATIRRKRRFELNRLVRELDLKEKHLPQTLEDRIKAIQSGDGNFDELANEYMGHVVNVAKETYVKYHDLDDKINIALVGLYEAALSYDGSHDVEFHVYCKRIMQRALYREHTHQTRKKRGGSHEDLPYEPKVLAGVVQSPIEHTPFSLTTVVHDLIHEKMSYKNEWEEQVAHARFLQGLSVTEIAKLTETKRYSVQGCQVKLKRQLIRLLSEEKYLD